MASNVCLTETRAGIFGTGKIIEYIMFKLVSLSVVVFMHSVSCPTIDPLVVVT